MTDPSIEQPSVCGFPHHPQLVWGGLGFCIARSPALPENEGAVSSSFDRRGGMESMKRFVTAILIAFSLAVALDAQTFRGSINGTVTDPSGGVIPNATVKATEIATGIDHTTTTTSDGAFAFQDIPLGFYKVVVTATGFPTYTVDKVEVIAGQIYTLQVKLQLQQQTTTVEVSAAALTLDTTTQTQTMTIPDDVVQNMPLNGRDFTQMISVAPGFGGYNVGGFGSLNGTRPNQVNWQINGVDNNDFWHNIPAINQGGVSGIAATAWPIAEPWKSPWQPSPGPEAGRNAGGTPNIVLKSGTNDLNGSPYSYTETKSLVTLRPSLFPRPAPRLPGNGMKTTVSLSVGRSSRIGPSFSSATRSRSSSSACQESPRSLRQPGWRKQVLCSPQTTSPLVSLPVTCSRGLPKTSLLTRFLPGARPVARVSGPPRAVTRF